MPPVESYGHRLDVLAQLDRAVGLTTAVRDEAQIRVSVVGAAMVPQRDTAWEIRAQRQWSRYEGLLESATNTPARRVGTRDRGVLADPREFATVACEELKPHLRSKGDLTE